MNEDMKIRISELSYAYEGYGQVLKDINLEIGQGEIVSILGPNGSGKTTLLKKIAGGLGVDKGAVYLDMMDIANLSSRYMAQNLAVVEQESIVGLDFAVEEVVGMGRMPYLSRFGTLSECDSRYVREALECTGLEEMKKRPVNKLSGGEKQRVFLACALAQEPEVLILDEPTSNLDIGYQLEIMEIIKRQVEQGVTVIMALHDINLAAHFSHRVLLLKEGVMVEYGPTEEVLTERNLSHTYGTEVKVHKNPLSNSIYVDFQTPVNNNIGHQKSIHVVCGGGSGIDIMHRLHGEYKLSCGVLSPLDSDYNAAKHLGIDMVVEAPFSSISQASFQDVKRMMEGCDEVVVSDTPFGEGNVLNLKVVSELSARIGKYLVNPGSIEKRDFTVNNKAVELIEDLKSDGAVEVRDYDQLVKELKGKA